MKRKIDEDLDRLAEIYRSDPLPSRDIDLEAYERKVREQDEKFGKFDDITPSHNKYDRIPLQHTIDRMKASYEEVGDRHRNNGGKSYKSWDASSFDLD